MTYEEQLRMREAPLLAKRLWICGIKGSEGRASNQSAIQPSLRTHAGRVQGPKCLLGAGGFCGAGIRGSHAESDESL
jgi:hypothetical protein